MSPPSCKWNRHINHGEKTLDSGSLNFSKYSVWLRRALTRTMRESGKNTQINTMTRFLFEKTKTYLKSFDRPIINLSILEERYKPNRYLT